MLRLTPSDGWARWNNSVQGGGDLLPILEDETGGADVQIRATSSAVKSGRLYTSQIRPSCLPMNSPAPHTVRAAAQARTRWQGRRRPPQGSRYVSSGSVIAGPLKESACTESHMNGQPRVKPAPRRCSYSLVTSHFTLRQSATRCGSVCRHLRSRPFSSPKRCLTSSTKVETPDRRNRDSSSE